MGLWDAIKTQLLDVVEWQDMDDNTIFYKWTNIELKKGSRLILRPAQDAIFLYQGRIEGIFTEEGQYDIESQIIPFLSTLAGFKFGFNSGLRAEVLVINTREFTVRWGTQNAINLPVQGLPGGMPIRAYGIYTCKVSDYNVLIEKVAGVQKIFTIDDVKARLSGSADQLLMKWIVKEGKDMFNLQANAYDIGKGIASDLAAEFEQFGMTCTGFQIQSVSYPDNVREMQEKAAGQAMIGNLNTYTTVAMADGMANGNGGAGNMAGTMASMQVGMMYGQQMVNQMQQNMQGAPAPNPFPEAEAKAEAAVEEAVPAAAEAVEAAAAPVAEALEAKAPEAPANYPNFCPNCGKKTEGWKFCPNCGTKLA